MKFILMFCLCLFASQSFASPFKVIIDAGHGGSDAGAVGGDTKESVLTLEISKKLEALLDKDSAFEAIPTRTQNRDISLGERCRLANQQKADLFLSIHMNSSPDPHARGTEIYFQSQMPPDEETLFLANRENSEVAQSEDTNFTEKKGDLPVIIDDIKKTQNIYASEIFAETLVKTWRERPWKKTLSLRDEPIRQGPFRVLADVPMPSVLIEVGFVTHKEDMLKLKNSQYQAQVAEAIFESIKKFKEQIDKAEFSGHIISHRL
jgi:N-acetylmuramoyl-L-alanine amidase